MFTFQRLYTRKKSILAILWNKQNSRSHCASEVKEDTLFRNCVTPSFDSVK